MRPFIWPLEVFAMLCLVNLVIWAVDKVLPEGKLKRLLFTSVGGGWKQVRRSPTERARDWLRGITKS